MAENSMVEIPCTSSPYLFSSFSPSTYVGSCIGIRTNDVWVIGHYATSLPLPNPTSFLLAVTRRLRRWWWRIDAVVHLSQARSTSSCEQVTREFFFKKTSQIYRIKTGQMVLQKMCFFKWTIPGLFYLFSSFQYSCQLMFDIYIFADDWIRTANLWNWKQPLYQLSHNHCP